MKFILTSITILFITVIANAQEFKFETETINYGKIKQDSNRERVFTFTNIGDAPLIIKRVQSTCGCAVPKKPEKPIMPNETGTITVSYDTHRIGGFSKAITVFSNAKIERKRLKIKGIVVAKKEKLAIK